MTLLLKQPTVSREHIAFLYAGELWLANRNGTQPQRLTAQKGQKSSPHFSPDGQWIAFSANYDGTQSVYVLPTQGGSPRRLTYHPYEDSVRGWTPDGKHILFSSALDSHFSRLHHLFTVPFEGGMPSRLPLPSAERGAFSPDGKLLAYTAYGEAFWTWKRYRGGMTVPIWVVDLASLEHREIPHENASDTFPCWLDHTIYFLSDRHGMMNLFRWDNLPGTADNPVEQLTHHADFDIRTLRSGAGLLAYEQAGSIHLYDPAEGKSTRLDISIDPDLPETRPTLRRVNWEVRYYSLSPSGKRAALEAHGEILTVPAKKGDIRNLTRTPGACERFPAWSPDGQSIAYLSDMSGEYELMICDQKGEQTKTIPLGKRTFFYAPLWSPDGKKIALTDKTFSVSILDLENGVFTHVDQDLYEHPYRSLNPAWSPDSRWLAYTRRLPNQIRAVFLYELTAGISHQVTDGMSDATNVCFSRNGKYLFFAASSNYGLNTGWLDMSSNERPVTRSLYVAVLNAEDPSPFAPESDEETPGDEDKEPEGEKKPANEEKAAENSPLAETPQVAGEEKPETAAVSANPVEESLSGEKAPKEKKPPEKPLKIDLEGLERRILALPVPARDYWALSAAEGDLLFYLELPPRQPPDDEPTSLILRLFDFKERKEDIYVPAVQSYEISANGKKLLYRAPNGGKFYLVDINKDKKPGSDEGALNLERLEIPVDPRAEWRQIFREAYRIHRDFFYDAALHGLDLDATYARYLPFLDHIGHRDDLNYLLSEFSGELVVGHAFVGGGAVPEREYVSVGMLGADFEVTPEGFYRIARILPGLNWHPELRSPLTEPGINIREGDFILAVNGQALHAPKVIYSLFERTADRIVDLKVASAPDDPQPRTVSVRPISNEIALRHWFWVENNRKRVDELSGGRLGYVYLPNTAQAGYDNFNRYYFSQLDKDGVVLDERYNSGGQVADYIVDLIDRPLLSYWATRDGNVFTSPNASIFGPKVMIINEQAGSGGDALPLFFRRRGLGKLVGKRTWGGLIGIYDYPTLIDGGYLTSPRLAIYSPEGEWEVENVGVAPDVEVEMTPNLAANGRDPQLEKAVEIALAELAAHPVQRKPRPQPAIKVERPR
jgi:tricorn protease